MRVLVTGGSGFIGTNMVELLVSRGHDVWNYDIAPPRNSAHSALWREGDLLNGSNLRSAVGDIAPEIILHLGARTDLEGRTVDEYAANTIGVENLIAAADRATSLRRLIFASSRLVCRIGYVPKDEFAYCPTTPYGESKVAGEKIVRAAKARVRCPIVIVRPTSIWGPWFGAPYKTFFLAIARGRYVHPGSAPILKSFGFVGNTVFQLERLMETPAGAVSGKTLYLADYPPTDVAVLANTVQRFLGARPIKTVPVCSLRPAARIGDGLKALGWRNPPLTSFRLGNLLTPMVHDLEPLEDIVGVLPFSMEAGVRVTIDWLRAQGEVS